MSNDTTTWMRKLDAAYRRASGAEGLNVAKPFASPVAPAPILVLGLNPAGNPSTWRLDVPKTAGSLDPYYGDGQLDYDVCDYPEAKAMRHLLCSACRSPRLAGQVVKSNLVFRRSPGADKRFSAYHGMSMVTAQREAQPFVADIIRRTDPSLIILQGNLLSPFTRLYSSGRHSSIDEPIITPAGRHSTALYEAYQCHVTALNRTVRVVKLAHPSTFGARYRRKGVDVRLRALLAAAAQRHHTQ